MKKLVPAILITFALAWQAPAEAQIFNRKPPVPPEQRIGALIVQAKTDTDERKRAAAASELRDFDGKNHPEIVSMLVDIARTDTAAGVRGEALASLAKIRPVSPAAGQALEFAAANDESWKVRMQAKSSLLRYQWAGYQSTKSETPATPTAKQPPMSQEPPLLEPRQAADTKSPRQPAASSWLRNPFKAAPAQAQNKTPSTPVITNQQPPFVAPQAPQAPRVMGTPTSAPTTVSQPRQALAPAVPPVAATPPPIVIDKRGAEPQLVLPPLPAAAGAVPKVTLPPLPVAAPPVEVTEPNFRPANTSPPRFTTAVPQVPRVTTDGPPLTAPKE